MENPDFLAYLLLVIVSHGHAIPLVAISRHHVGLDQRTGSWSQSFGLLILVTFLFNE